VFLILQILLGTLGVLCLFVIAFFLGALVFKRSGKKSQVHKILVENLTEKLTKQKHQVLKDMGEDVPKIKPVKAQKKKKFFHKTLSVEDKSNKKCPRIFVLTFQGDVAASATARLTNQVNVLSQILTPEDEVVVKLESPGGYVNAYGLASSQLLRLKEKTHKLTICVDKVAASGGYMMACVGHRILAAPFAVLGSIGAVTGIPNVHKWLKKNDIDYFELTAGAYKRTLTPLGEPTEAGKAKLLQQLQEVHDLFKNMVKHHRPQLDLEKVATGEYWYGQQCVDLGLVDGIKTSDDYLMEKFLESERLHKDKDHKNQEGQKIQIFALTEETTVPMWKKLMAAQMHVFKEIVN